MGLISGLLTLPVTGPFKGVGWVLEKIAESAEREYYVRRLLRNSLRIWSTVSMPGKSAKNNSRRKKISFSTVFRRYVTIRQNKGLKPGHDHTEYSGKTVC